MKDEIKRVATWLVHASRAVCFDGAGVSVASGIPDFRSAGGLYEQEPNSEWLLSHQALVDAPERFWSFFRRVFWAPNTGPNRIHRTLVAYERAGWLRGVMTQNVDGLHQAAGSKHVLELHGSAAHVSCSCCRRMYRSEEITLLPTVPLCPVCGGALRPDVVLYGEALDRHVIAQAIKWLSEADLVLVAGTSLVVQPAAGLLTARSRHAKLVVVNREVTPYDDEADLVLSGDLLALFSALDDAVSALRA